MLASIVFLLASLSQTHEMTGPKGKPLDHVVKARVGDVLRFDLPALRPADLGHTALAQSHWEQTRTVGYVPLGGHAYEYGDTTVFRIVSDRPPPEYGAFRDRHVDMRCLRRGRYYVELSLMGLFNGMWIRVSIYTYPVLVE